MEPAERIRHRRTVKGKNDSAHTVKNCVQITDPDHPVTTLFAVITDLRDRATFMLMLRCGLRVHEVTPLTAEAAESEYSGRQIFVSSGKGAEGRVVYVSEKARSALTSCARRGTFMQNARKIQPL